MVRVDIILEKMDRFFVGSQELYIIIFKLQITQTTLSASSISIRGRITSPARRFCRGCWPWPARAGKPGSSTRRRKPSKKISSPKCSSRQDITPDILGNFNFLSPRAWTASSQGLFHGCVPGDLENLNGGKTIGPEDRADETTEVAHPKRPWKQGAQ